MKDHSNGICPTPLGSKVQREATWDVVRGGKEVIGVLVFGKTGPRHVGQMSRSVIGKIPVEMRGCQAKLVSAVDTAEVVDAGSDDAMGYLHAYGVEKEAARTGTHPKFLEREIAKDLNPDFSGEGGIPVVRMGWELRTCTFRWDKNMPFEHVEWSCIISQR